MRKYVEVFTRDHLPKLRDQLLFSGLTDHEIFMFIQYAKPYYLSLNRGELANYLAVDRASLSRALGELKKAGIIEFKKSHFKLIETAEYHFD